MAIRPTVNTDLRRLQQIGLAAEKEWLPVMKHGVTQTVNSFHKGLAQKFEIVFESGHVVAGKPILPETLFGLEQYKTVPFKDLQSRQQRGMKRAEWEYQGWSEIVSYHVDKVLGFHKKPPIVGRVFSSKELYANDPTWTGLIRRLGPSYDIPLALLPWVDGLQRAIPSLEIRDYLIGNSTSTVSRSFLSKALAAADKLIFDFLVDDHDTQGTQNWKADMSGTLLHWDTGLGWKDGPYAHTSCYDILCGTKAWKGVEHHDPNPETCDRICKFRKSTVEKLRHLQQETDSKKRLGWLVNESLKADELYPVFDLAIWRYYTYDKDGNRASSVTTHTSVDDFFIGMNDKIDRLLRHVDDCALTFGGEENILLEE
eukprot:CAMPEP_0206183466 /NCGR_PEP_ID=MMETSP0166-20121206/655_1 /ASSEMBLY_ACC=CAM_ASM_000260 /TAXON_ID=95228 /ORGANISM="Vannella robusta, Strain DIVA3 518/3/11/1/6" /LENGTH=369 /DNA_ID=CAMNT_0053598327 /DNA_START=125 /DNA_END=1234 /DNA_ORIENTATION=+